MLGIEEEQVDLFRQMCEHACFVTASAIEIGCRRENDDLNFLS